jgi:uncharacterized repeat protein (TIGR01451 family)
MVIKSVKLFFALALAIGLLSSVSLALAGSTEPIVPPTSPSPTARTLGASPDGVPTEFSPASLSTPLLLQAALDSGEIDAERYYLYLAYALGDSDMLPVPYHSEVPWDGTLPLLRLQEAIRTLRADSVVRTTVERLLAGRCGISSTVLPNIINSTHYHIEYGTIGGGLDINAYAASLETAWATEVISYGWAAPPVSFSDPPPGDRYHVRIDNLGSGLYGYVTNDGVHAGFVGDNPNTTWDDTDAFATCMVLSNDYSGFPGTAQQALDATTGHEFNHSIQFGYGALHGFNAPDDAFTEGGATWMEDEVFDAADDNYNYLWPTFSMCMGEYTASPYAYWITFRGMTERYGTGTAGAGEQIMQDFWEETSRGTGNNLSAMSTALGNAGTALPDAYHAYAIAVKFLKTCGGGYAYPYCFEEAAGYVNAKGIPAVHGTISGVGGSHSGSIADNYALNWVSLPTTGGPYDVTLENLSGGGQLRGSVVCDTSSELKIYPLPSVAGPGVSSTLFYFEPSGCASVVAVLTNQAQTADNPSSCPARSYQVRTAESAGAIPTWSKLVYLNDTLMTDDPVSVQPGDTVRIVDRVQVAHTRSITFALMESWTAPLELSSWITETGEVAAAADHLTWEVSDMPPDTWYAITKTFHITQLSSLSGIITETLTVEDGPAPEQRVRRFVIPVTVDKAGPSVAFPGDLVSYTVVVQNGTLLPDTAVLTDELPAGVAFAGGLTSTHGTAWYSDTSNTVYWSNIVTREAVGIQAPSDVRADLAQDMGFGALTLLSVSLDVAITFNVTVTADAGDLVTNEVTLAIDGTRLADATFTGISAPQYFWQKTASVNGAAYSPGQIIKANDQVRVVDAVWITFPLSVDIHLTEAWSESLSLTGYATDSGDVTTGTRELNWTSAALPGTWQILTKTFTVMNGAWNTDAITETLVIEGLEPEERVVQFSHAYYKVGLSAAENQLSDLIGGRVTYTLAVENQGTVEDGLTVSLNGHRWATTSSQTIINALPAGSTTTLDIYVTVPLTASDGLTDTVDVGVTLLGDATAYDAVTLSTTAEWFKVYMPVVLREP